MNERFLFDVLYVLDAFPIFDLEKVPIDYSANEFPVYCNTEVEILCEYYFGTHNEREIILLLSGTVGLISLWKKWFQLKKNLSRNKLKPDINATKGFLK